MVDVWCKVFKLSFPRKPIYYFNVISDQTVVDIMTGVFSCVFNAEEEEEMRLGKSQTLVYHTG